MELNSDDQMLITRAGWTVVSPDEVALPGDPLRPAARPRHHARVLRHRRALTRARRAHADHAALPLATRPRDPASCTRPRVPITDTWSRMFRHQQFVGSLVWAWLWAGQGRQQPSAHYLGLYYLL